MVLVGSSDTTLHGCLSGMLNHDGYIIGLSAGILVVAFYTVHEEYSAFTYTVVLLTPLGVHHPLLVYKVLGQEAPGFYTHYMLSIKRVIFFAVR